MEIMKLKGIVKLIENPVKETPMILEEEILPFTILMTLSVVVQGHPTISSTAANISIAESGIKMTAIASRQ